MQTKNKKHIYQITAYYPPHVGGMENLVENLSKKLVERNYTVDVETSEIGSKKSVVKSKKLTVNYLTATEILSTPISFELYSRLKDAEEGSIFHLHIAQAFFPEITAWVARNKKIPLVCHIHLDVGNTTGIGAFLLPIYKNIFLRRVLKMSQKVIVQNQDYKELIHKKYQVDLKKIVVIPNGVNLAERNPSKFLTIKPPYKILFVGRLVSQKRADLFIRSIQLLVQRNYPIIAEIVGSGPDEESLKKLTSELNLESFIKFSGSIPNSEVAKKYGAADCLVQTSERESFSTVLLEALNYGCPIVASDIPGTRNFLNFGNSVLSNDNPESFANAIELITSDMKLRKSIISGSYETIKQFSWDSILDKIEVIYSDLL